MGHSEIFRIQLQLCFRHTQIDIAECILFSKIVSFSWILGESTEIVSDKKKFHTYLWLECSNKFSRTKHETKLYYLNL
jgi:hypothetical protein